MGTNPGGGGETKRQHSLVEVLDLQELVALLEQLEDKQANQGALEPRDAVVRAAVERRLLAIVTTPGADVERRESMRIPCDLEVSVVAAGTTAPARATDLGPGGVFITTNAALSVGARIEVHVTTNTGERPLHVRGRVTWQQTGRGAEPGVGIAFDELTRDADLRRLWRLIVRLLHARSS